ncbi:mannitol dehydrogenase family protein [Kineococcus sp. NUM-3379]
MSPSSTPLPLREATLPSLAHGIDVPRYDRAALRPSVVHIGVGGFHRAHQAVYLDDLARRGETGWGVVGVGLHSRAVLDALDSQDGLYSVLTRGQRGDRVRVVGSLVRRLFAPDDPAGVLDALADPGTRLVTLTITGAAYATADTAGDGTARDGTFRGSPGPPRTAMDYLVAALARRRDAGTRPFTVLSCDNLPGNGAVTREAVLAAARLRDASLADWIAGHVAFPAGMVDRITPQAAPEHRELLAREHGVDDRCPVVTEPFSQWFVEDRFGGERPPLEDVGVRFVRDVRPYELMKTRLLNGAHSALGHLGGLAGLTTGAEVLADPVLRRYTEGYLAEAAAVLGPVPGIDLAAYRGVLVQRLSSAALADRLARLRRRGSEKIAAFVLPSLRLAVQEGSACGHLALAVAAWVRTLRGQDLCGRPVAVDDPVAPLLQPLARTCGHDPRPLLAVRDLFGDAVDDPRLVEAVRSALHALDTGPSAAARACTATGSVQGPGALRGSTA